MPGTFCDGMPPWLDCIVNHTGIDLDDPGSDLADCNAGRRRFQYRIRDETGRGAAGNSLRWNGHSLADAPDPGLFGRVVPPCPSEGERGDR